MWLRGDVLLADSAGSVGQNCVRTSSRNFIWHNRLILPEFGDAAGSNEADCGGTQPAEYMTESDTKPLPMPSPLESRMIRRLVGSLALTLVLAVSANAQIISFTDPSFHVNAIAGTGFFDGGSVNGVSGSLSATHPLYEPYAAGQSFQVWCVDETHASVPNTSWPVVVTMMNSGTFAPYLHDANALPSYTDYEKAAWLTTQMSGTSDTGPGNTAIQLAIWEVMGYTGYTSHVGYAGNAAAVASWFGAANLSANYGSINTADWMIITDNGACALTQANSGCNQELLAQVVPEPGTMAMVAMGLVGIAGTGLRRRKK
jgi:hypothetical protein